MKGLCSDMAKRIKLFLLISASFALVWMVVQASIIQDYIESIKYGGTAVVPVFQQSSPNDFDPESFKLNLSGEQLKLFEQIEQEAQALTIKPIDAQLDSVWKAIPGYNGVEVDLYQTFQYAIKLDGNIPFVYQEIKPKINLENLGAHPIYKGNPHKPMVSFMINVAWGNQYIPTILQTLAAENVKATFFLDGSWLSKNKSTAQEILDQGHELSNHAYSHKNMSTLSRYQAMDEINKTQNLLTDLGVHNELFAPPSGDYDQETVDIANELQLKTVLWTIDTVDWKKPDPRWIERKIAANLEPGAIILMHPTSSSSIALSQMIQDIKTRGLVVGTVSELLSTDRIFEVETRFDF